MPTLFKDLNLKGADGELFLIKINKIHNTINNLRVKVSERKGNE